MKKHTILSVVCISLLAPAGCFEGPGRGSGTGPAPSPNPVPLGDGGVDPTPGCGGAGDLDGDCVPNAQDRCSRTPAGAAVWKTGAWAGCASGQYKDVDDGDRDGVPNAKDQCPGTAAGAQVDALGCGPGQQKQPAKDGSPPPPPPPPPKDTGVPKQDKQAPKQDTGSGGGLTLSAAEKDLIQAINKERSSLGVGTVVADAKLMCTARLAAKSGSCGHYAGGSWITRGKQCGLSDSEAWLINEIATGPGFTDGAMCVWGWKSSSGHYWGLKHPQAKKIGVAKNSQGCWWAIFDCCIKGS